MVMGVPARVRPLEGDTYRRRTESSASIYVDNARTYPTAMERVDLGDCITG
jgi:hypothetical protein